MRLQGLPQAGGVLSDCSTLGRGETQYIRHGFHITYVTHKMSRAQDEWGCGRHRNDATRE